MVFVRRILRAAGVPVSVEVGRASGRTIPATSGLSWFFDIPPGNGLLSEQSHRLAKRALDLALIALTLPFSAALFVLCFVAIKLESPRDPAFFMQERTGLGGRRFRMLKFRTMVVKAEVLKGQLVHMSRLKWPDFKIDDDPRITRIGRLLRRTSLDELPQLINVLRNDMSLVGPRPTSFPVETYEEWQKARLSVPPGLTGIWQISGRASLEFDDRVRPDLAYIERQSLALDLQIILRTVGSVLSQDGAC